MDLHTKQTTPHPPKHKKNKNKCQSNNGGHGKVLKEKELRECPNTVSSTLPGFKIVDPEVLQSRSGLSCLFGPGEF